jgi:hypothetical protein
MEGLTFTDDSAAAQHLNVVSVRVFYFPGKILNPGKPKTTGRLGVPERMVNVLTTHAYGVRIRVKNGKMSN